MRGRRGVRRREPDVERHHAGLQSEADEREEEEGGTGVGRRDAPRERDEVGRPRERAEEREEAEEDERRDVRREEVEPPRVARLAGAAVGRDEEEGGEGHHLPGREEEEDVPRDEDEGDRPGRQPVEEAGPPRVVRVLVVAEEARPGHGGKRRDEEERDEEEGREGVEAHVEGGPRERPHAREALDPARHRRPDRSRQAEEPARDGAGGRDPARPNASGEEEPGDAPGRAEDGSGENEEEAHRGGIHPRTTLHARSATSVPRT